MGSRTQFELLGLDIQELTDVVLNLGQPAYRARQLAQAMYRERRNEICQISTLPIAVRERLSTEGFSIGLPTVDRRFVSVDGTVRYLMRMSDGQTVETVWMPEGDGGEAGDGSEAGEEELEDQGTGPSDEASARPASASHTWHRATICVSSQVGCAVNCRFCMTAQLGAVRSLTAGEIVGQILTVLNDHHVDLERSRVNLVFMGQGEPFLNYLNFMKAVRLLVSEVGIAEPRMTVSTSGIVPRIAEFGLEPVRPKLAVSLNGSNDEVRERVMPINRKWNLAALLESLRSFPLRPRERLTFEYVLLDGVNDSPENACEVVRLLQGLRAKVNLIALNPGPGIPFAMPSPDRVAAFQRVLVEAGIPAYVRRPRGRDIFAACGQLKRTTELTQVGS